MKYVYDIILNFNECFYNFYEWRDSDKILYVKKIPIFRVDDDVIEIFKRDDIKVDISFINKLDNNFFVYSDINVKSYSNTCVFCSSNDIVAIKFDIDGRLIMRSDLIMDEATDIISYSKDFDIIDLDYIVLKRYDERLVRRSIFEKILYINHELDSIHESNDIDKLKYIYYECFSKYNDNVLEMYDEIESFILSNPDKIFDILELSNGLQN